MAKTRLRKGECLSDNDFTELYDELVAEVHEVLSNVDDWCEKSLDDLHTLVSPKVSFLLQKSLLSDAIKSMDPPGIKPGTSRLIPPPMNDFNGWSYEMTNGLFGANLDGSGCSIGWEPTYYKTREEAEYEVRVEAFTYGIEGSVVEIVSEEKAQEILKEMGYDRPSV